MIGGMARSLLVLVMLSPGLASAHSTATDPSRVQPGQGTDAFLEDFQSAQVGEDGVLASPIGRFIVEGEGELEVMNPRVWQEGELGLRLPGGEATDTVIEVAPTCAFGGTLEFIGQRDGRKRPFAFLVTLVGRDGVDVVHDFTDQINAKDLRSIAVEVPSGLAQVRFSVTAPLRRGVWIDDLRFVPPMPMRLESTKLTSFTRPLVHGEHVQVGVLEVRTTGGLEPLVIADPKVREVIATTSDEGSPGAAPAQGEAATLMGGFTLGDGDGSLQLVSGINRLPVYVAIDLWESDPKDAAWSTSVRYDLSFTVGEQRLTVGTDSASSASEPAAASWPAVRVVASDVEVSGVSLASIPEKDERGAVLVAAVSTPSGMMLKRSLDGGCTWLDASLGADVSGLLAASLVLDSGREKLHLIAEKEGGLVHASSKDQGASWSEPRSLEGLGPGPIAGSASSGVFMSTGELVVPCIIYGGFRIEGEPCAGIVFSRDGGRTWQTNQAAYANTTTSTAVEIGPGALLLNMTDGRGALRSERSTRDLGESWARRSRVALENLHRSVGSDGAMVHLGRARGKGWDGRLVFANAETDRLPMRNMTLKGSSDSASSWPLEHRILLDDGVGVDHPSLVPVGAAEVGVAYAPSSGGVIFQRLPEAVVVPKAASWFDVTGGR